jgi:uncharacterized cupin superfamily protein
MPLRDCRIIELPRVQDARGNLTFIESLSHVPFHFERIYWIYDIPGGEQRGGHAYRTTQEFLIALSGSFDVVLDDGTTSRVMSLNRSYFGVYVPNMVWRHLQNFSTNTVCLVLASTAHRESDYIRDHDESNCRGFTDRRAASPPCTAA